MENLYRIPELQWEKSPGRVVTYSAFTDDILDITYVIYVEHFTQYTLTCYNSVDEIQLNRLDSFEEAKLYANNHFRTFLEPVLEKING